MPVKKSAEKHVRASARKQLRSKSSRSQAKTNIIKAEKRNIPLSNFSSNEAWKKIKEYNPNYALFEQFV